MTVSDPQPRQALTEKVLSTLTDEQATRFWQRVDRTTDDECWRWLGPVHPHGYGIWSLNLGHGEQTTMRPHRVAYVLEVGSIPPGLTLDHLCGNKTCCNPSHLEPVTVAENRRRAGPGAKPTKGRASIHPRPLSDGRVSYRVMFRIDGVQRSETFYDPAAAAQFQALCARIGPAAALAVRNARTDVALGGAPSLTLGQWLEQHLARATDIEAGSVAEYRRVAARTWGPVLGDIPLVALTKDDVARWVTWQRAQHTRRGKPPAAKTIRNAHALLSTVVASAVAEGHLPSNVAKGAAPPAGHRDEMTFLTPDEFAFLLAFVPEHEQPVVTLLAGTGMRWGEAAALRWSDLELDADVPVVRISRAWKRGETGRVLGAPKTRRSRRTVSLPPQVVDVLRGLRGQPDDLLFHARRGGPLRHQAWHSRVWNPAVDRANDPGRLGIPRLAPVLGKRPRPHDLRHSHASWLISAGVPLPIIQQRLGHESIKTTVDVYGHLLPDALSVGAAAASAALVQAMPELEG